MSWAPYRFWHKLAAAASLPLILACIVATGSRLGMVGFLSSLILYVLCWGIIAWRGGKNGLVGPAVVLSYPVTLILFCGAILSVPRLRAMTLGGSTQANSTEARGEQFHAALPLIIRHPLGFGIAQGGQALNYRSAGGILTVDSQFLLTALDFGILGFIMFYGMYAIAIWYGFRGFSSNLQRRELTLVVPISIALAVYVLIKSIYHGYDNQPLSYMMLGAVVALIYPAEGRNRGDQTLCRRQAFRRTLTALTLFRPIVNPGGPLMAASRVRR